MRDHHSTPQAVCLHPDVEEGDEASACLFSMVSDVEDRPHVGRAGQPLRTRIPGDRPVRDAHVTQIAATRFGAPLPAGRHDRRLRAAAARTTTAATSSGRWNGGRARGTGSSSPTASGPRTTTSPARPQQRADDLNALFADPDVDVIQVLWGGTGAMQVLAVPRLRPDRGPPEGADGLLRHHEPAFRAAPGGRLGHPARPGPGLHGHPGAHGLHVGLGAGGLHRPVVPGAVPRDPDDPYVRTIAPGRSRRRSWAATSSPSSTCMGTRWDPALDGAIVFFEEVHEPAYVIEVHLDQLRLAGKLEGDRRRRGRRAEGLRLDRGAARGPQEPLAGGCPGAHLAPLGVPVLYKLPLGHGKHLASIPLGVTATLDADARTLTIDEPGVVAVPYRRRRRTATDPRRTRDEDDQDGRSPRAAIVMVGGLALSGAAPGAGSPARPPTDEKVVSTSDVDSDVTSLNPYKLCCGPDYEYLGLRLRHLVRLTATPWRRRPASSGVDAQRGLHRVDAEDPRRRHLARRPAPHRRGRRVLVPARGRQRHAVLQGLPPVQPDLRGRGRGHGALASKEPTFAPEVPPTSRSFPSTSGASSWSRATRSPPEGRQGVRERGGDRLGSLHDWSSTRRASSCASRPTPTTGAGSRPRSTRSSSPSTEPAKPWCRR